MFTVTVIKKIFAVLFLTATVSAAAVNIHSKRNELAQAFDGVSFPRSFAEATETMKRVQKVLSTTFTAEEALLETHSRLLTLVGKKEVDAYSLVRDENGFLFQGDFLAADTSQLHEFAARLYWLKRVTTDAGTKTIFLNPPDRVVKGFSSFATGLPNRNENPAQDTFLFYLGEYGVDYLDARRILAESALPRDQWMFKTDENWTPQAAFTTFQALIRHMDTVFSGRLDPDNVLTAADKYYFENFPDAFLGDMGRRTGKHFSGLDSFTTIRPVSSATYAVEWLDSSGTYRNTSGPAEDTLFSPDALRRRGDYQSRFPAFNTAVDKRWMKITNTDKQDGPSLFLIHDEFGATLVPFLAPLFGEMHTALSSRGAYAVNIDEYLAANIFDYIIVALSPKSYTDDGMPFFTGPKDQLLPND